MQWVKHSFEEDNLQIFEPVNGPHNYCQKEKNRWH